MSLEEKVREMADRILAGDNTINVCDIVKYIKENRDESRN